MFNFWIDNVILSDTDVRLVHQTEEQLFFSFTELSLERILLVRSQLRRFYHFFF